MPEWIIIGLVSFFTGVAASLGLGGGFVLLIYLTAFAGVPQLEAQGINLIFFLPIAALSLIFHTKNKLIDKKPLLPSILTGAAAVVLGVLLAGVLGSKWLSKLFAIFILYVGIKELFHKKSEKTAENSGKRLENT